MHSGSDVVRAMQEHSEETHEAWRKLVADGKGNTPEGIAAYDAAQLAGATLTGELLSRLQLVAAHQRPRAA